MCDKTYELFQQPPYQGLFELVEPLEPISLEEARAFDCSRNTTRHPRETKGKDYRLTTEEGDACCDPNGCC